MAKVMPVNHVPAAVSLSFEWRQRMATGRVNTKKPVFEGDAHAVAVVTVTRAWAGKDQIITSVPSRPTEAPFAFKIGEPAGTLGAPVLCFKNVRSATDAKFLQRQLDGPLKRGTSRQLCLFKIGTVGAGKKGIKEVGAGALHCVGAVPVSLAPLPASALAKVQPLPPFWLPARGKPDKENETPAAAEEGDAEAEVEAAAAVGLPPSEADDEFVFVEAPGSEAGSAPEAAVAEPLPMLPASPDPVPGGSTIGKALEALEALNAYVEAHKEGAAEAEAEEEA